jgi:molecular chaperone DnaJ
LLDAVRGVERQVVVTRQVACAACHGAGRMAVPESRCQQCGGTGRTRWARGHMVFSKACSACDGTGRRTFQPCAACAGFGRAVRTEAIAVHVPPAVTDGTGIRVAEKGHTGRNGGRTGDLYVTVHVQPHAQFRREGDNLVCTIPVPVHAAVLGGEIDVPIADGTTVRLRIPPGTQGGQRFRLSGHGVPTLGGGRRGDLFVDVQLVLPEVVDERSKALLQEFVEREARGRR